MLIFRCRLTHQAVQTIYQTALTRGIICLHDLVCYWANAIYKLSKHKKYSITVISGISNHLAFRRKFEVSLFNVQNINK